LVTYEVAKQALDSTGKASFGLQKTELGDRIRSARLALPVALVTYQV